MSEQNPLERHSEADPYLILHKVRGLAAYDIAHTIQVGGERWWIVSTSGWRAYPIAVWPLHAMIADRHHLNAVNSNEKWPDLRDHFSIDSKAESRTPERRSPTVATLQDLENL